MGLKVRRGAHDVKKLSSNQNLQTRYYGEADSPRLTYLEFGSIDRVHGRKDIWDFRIHQQAYDFFMVSRYINDLVLCRQLTAAAAGNTFLSQLRLYAAGVHTNDLSITFARLAALQILDASLKKARAPVMFELGSTIMGCIDTLECLQAIGVRFSANFSTVDLSRVRFSGIEISSLLNAVGKALHSTHVIDVTTDGHARQADLFVAKGVSLLYVAKHATDIADLIGNAAVSLFDYSFALSSGQQDYLGTGKKVTYCSLREVVDRCKARGKTVLVRASGCIDDRAKKRLRCQCYCGDPKLLRRVIDEEWRLMRIVSQAFDTNLSDVFGSTSWRTSRERFRGDFIPAERFLHRRESPTDRRRSSPI